jgi:competence protein ComFC
MRIIDYFRDFSRLFFPDNCAACGNILVTNEETICTSCLYHIPKTNYHTRPDNPVSEVFWGRTRIEKATSFFFFHKSTHYQHIIHNLKYRGNKDVGILMGRYFATDLKDNDFHSDIDMIVPVPLHPKKLRLRGYNQSEMIARGIADVWKIELNPQSLKRTTFTETQTRKSRIDRWLNVESVFEVADPETIKGKHILLVDDVLTTGATLEACANALLKVDGVKVSVATLAYAKN